MKNVIQKMQMVFIFVLLLAIDISAQDFFTGKIGATLSGAGRIRLYSDSLTTKQIERASIIVGTGNETVFTYNEDAENLIPAINVLNPQQSDFEMVGTADNSYSFLPPDVSSRANVYGWVNGSFILIKYTIMNRELSEINAFIGMETIAEIDNSAGLETVEYLPFEKIVSFYRLPSSSYFGCKILSSDFYSSRTFDWTSDYDTSDSFLYSLLTSGMIDTLFDSQGDGAVSIFNQNSVTIPAGDSTEYWVGISYGIDETGMLENMDEVQSFYDLITDVPQNINAQPTAFELNQNYPNPFNPSTTISFSIPQQQQVMLKVFNALGQEVAVIVDRELQAGQYNYTFNAADIPSGIYFYTLTAGNNSITKKMILLK